MDKFWQLLRRVNVQLIAILLVLALVGIIVWRLWVAYATPWQTVEPPSLEDAGNGTNTVGESFFSWSSELRAPRQIERNPFSSPVLEDFLAQEEMKRVAAEKLAAEQAAAARAAAKEAAAAKAAAELVAARQAAEEEANGREAAKVAAQVAAQEAAKPKPVPPPETRDVVLVYRGMMIRPDQTTLALIENKTDGNTAFYKTGDSLTGLRIGDIQRNTLGFALPAGTNQTVTVNMETSFKETLSNGR